jgi:hypothetical protein
MSEENTYQWIELKPLEIPGDMARVLNRRIATQLQLRVDIDGGKYTQTRLRPGSSPITEALRREVFIRRDTVRLLEFKNMSAGEARAALAAVDKALLEAL